MKNKGVSNVLSAVIMVSLVIILMVFLWGFVTTFVIDKTEESGDCYEAFDKINLIDQFTCYNESSNELYFAIGLEDVEIEKVSVNVFSGYIAKNFDLSYSPKKEIFLREYDSEYNNDFTLPDKESAKTYVLNLIEAGFPKGFPESIEVVPEYEEKCQAADSIYDIDKCYS